MFLEHTQSKVVVLLPLANLYATLKLYTYTYVKVSKVYHTSRTLRGGRTLKMSNVPRAQKIENHCLLPHQLSFIQL